MMTGHRWMEAALMALREFETLGRKSLAKKNPRSLKDLDAKEMARCNIELESKRALSFLSGARVLVERCALDWSTGRPVREVRWRTPGYVVSNDGPRCIVLLGDGETHLVDKKCVMAWDADVVEEALDA